MILITGATGSNGMEILKRLAAHSIPARAMVRDLTQAEDISFANVEVVQGDFNAPESLFAALDNVDKAFLLTPSSENAELRSSCNRLIPPRRCWKSTMKRRS